MGNGLTPEKPRLIRPAKVKDWKGLTYEVSMALAKSFSAVIEGEITPTAAVGILESLLSGIKEISWENSEDELLWKLITRAMWQAAFKLANEDSHGDLSALSGAERKKMDGTNTIACGMAHERP